jgi:RNA polymerase sigma-70 factor (ECF subfamily)
MKSTNQINLENHFNDLYQKSFSRVYRYIYRLIGNNEDSKQLTQQAFTRLYGYFLAKPIIKNEKALLFRIATNSCFSYLRKKKNEKALNSECVDAPPQHDPLQDVIRNQRKELIQRALAQLHPRDRLCILLYLEELSYSEIADAMRMNKTTVGKALLRAIERLSRQIGNGDKL